MPASRHWRKKNVRQSLALPRRPWKPRRRRPITLPMSIETVLALFTLCFVIKATPGHGVFATVGRALFQGFGPTLVFIAGIMAGDLLYLVFALTGLAVMFISILGGTFSAYAYAAARARLLFRSKRAMKRVNRGAGTGGAVAAS